MSLLQGRSLNRMKPMSFWNLTCLYGLRWNSKYVEHMTCIPLCYYSTSRHLLTGHMPCIINREALWLNLHKFFTPSTPLTHNVCQQWNPKFLMIILFYLCILFICMCNFFSFFATGRLRKPFHIPVSAENFSCFCYIKSKSEKCWHYPTADFPNLVWHQFWAQDYWNIFYIGRYLEADIFLKSPRYSSQKWKIILKF